MPLMWKRVLWVLVLRCTVGVRGLLNPGVSYLSCTAHLCGAVGAWIDYITYLGLPAVTQASHGCLLS